MRLLRVIAGVSGAMAIGFAAYAAHGIDGQAAEWIEKGSRYQLIHAAVLLAPVYQGRWGKFAAALFVAGMVLFSGSLYVMALSGTHLPLVPFGGTAFILGWLCLAVSALRSKP
jgi:uncharacterized membrane protein YgdD (TMEM256/DUF423 family)